MLLVYGGIRVCGFSKNVWFGVGATYMSVVGGGGVSHIGHT